MNNQMIMVECKDKDMTTLMYEAVNELRSLNSNIIKIITKLDSFDEKKSSFQKQPVADSDISSIDEKEPIKEDLCYWCYKPYTENDCHPYCA